MNVLAIDTATYASGAALLQDGIVRSEKVTFLKKNHSIRVMPAVDHVLSEADVTPADLDHIIVGEGPGSYTGVRIGVTTAKSLAWALDIPATGVSSLEVLAERGGMFHGRIFSFFDARRGQVYGGVYERDAAGGLKQVQPDALKLMTDFTAELAEAEGEILCLSPDLAQHEDVLKETLAHRAVFGRLQDMYPHPADVLAVGMRKEAAQSVHALAPNYGQLAEAEKKRVEAEKGGRHG
ncbi:tRNA threonylcarbamoyladenosine biosynthesis protein TsaB [Salsuginibacillus halophilus]|uniref:tRNA threonylcarbamoyladenosine biosynthesis protein TsaB n=1 Tax=Salsuginibacillus halophilus TaxID=517424 RepID=A0A2P8HL71_9BACI|nr:tRNA (adenosine(37)-N6)-threonylcarbamoyltransferase complex dimerization subunit type 1 TsaB [Salsuginibacillus halophilus]PSL46930.1 tRNA threonylcarbamoyladenosine biosynthesis protein TsaB [Salsuginibacillus halophilus]